MAKARKYFTLVTREGGDGSPWCPQFGDYDRETVEDERNDYADRGDYRVKDMRIIVSNDDQASINARIATLNGSN